VPFPRTRPLNYGLWSGHEAEQRELRLKVVGLKVVEWVLAVCALAFAAAVCFVLAALGAYAPTRLDLPPVLQAALIVFSPIAGIWLALVIGAKAAGNKPVIGMKSGRNGP